MPAHYQLWWTVRRQRQGDPRPDHATAGDMIAVELGLRQLQELGVEGAVMGALAEQARVRRALVQLPQAVSGWGGARMKCALSAH